MRQLAACFAAAADGMMAVPEQQQYTEHVMDLPAASTSHHITSSSGSSRFLSAVCCCCVVIYLSAVLPFADAAC